MRKPWLKSKILYFEVFTGLIPHCLLAFCNTRLCLTWWESPEVPGIFQENKWWITATLGRGRIQLSWQEKIKINWPVTHSTDRCRLKGEEGKDSNREQSGFTALVVFAFALSWYCPDVSYSTLMLMAHTLVAHHCSPFLAPLLWRPSWTQCNNSAKQSLCQGVLVQAYVCLTYLPTWHASNTRPIPVAELKAKGVSLHRGTSKAEPSWSLTTWTGQSISTKNVSVFKHTLLRGNTIFYGKYTPIANNKGLL